MKPRIVSTAHLSSILIAILATAFAVNVAGARSADPNRPLLTWVQGPDAETPHYLHTSFYDSHGHRMVAYQGRSDELSLIGAPAWDQLPTQSPYHYGYVIVQDPQLRRALVLEQGGGPVAVWENKIGGTTWTQIVASGAPTGNSAAAIFDPVRRRVLFFTEPNLAWQLDLSGTPTWSSLSAAGTPPDFISKETTVYDPIADRLLVLGANSQLFSLSLSGTPTWSQQAISGAPGTGAGAVTFDTRSDRMVFFLGYQTDTWSVELTGPNAPRWVLLASGGAMHERVYHSLVHDPINDRLVLFGGYWSGVGQSYFQDTWFLDFGNSSAPHLDVAPTELDFGTAVAPTSRTATVDVTNTGNRPSVTFAVVSSDPNVTVDATAFSLAPLDSRTLTVTWNVPTGTTLDATVEIESNDPDTPSWVIPVTGTATGSSGVDPGSMRGFRLALAGANPVRGAARFELSLPQRARADVAVYDVRGSLVKSLAAGDLGPGQHHFDWDGTDGAGRHVAAGLYFVRATSAGRSSQVKVAMAR